jgi:rod shape-determining protein MreC
MGLGDDWFVSTGNERELRTQVADLQVQVDQLTVENVRLREYEAEVQQLRSLLNFTSEYPLLSPLGAEVVDRETYEESSSGDVIGTDTNPYLRYVTINVGAQQGVEVGMPVVSNGAVLVGRILEVAPRTSQVQLLSDSNSAVAALLQTSRASGLVSGQVDGTLHLDYISQDEEVSIGDMVLTSGLGGTLPKGLVIGQVAEVQDVDYELFQSIIVRPALDFSRLETLLVLTTFKQVPLVEIETEEQ